MRLRNVVFPLVWGGLVPLAQAEEPAVPAKAVAPVVVAAPADAKPNPDPWEKFNRAVFSFNDKADHYVLKPVAKGYKAVTPSFVRTGVSNFFTNLRSPLVMLNDLLQGKVKDAGSDTVRFVVNSTVGIVGLFDVSSRLGLPLHDEDFGQTLGVWGVKPGPYLMLPLFGPSTVRDAAGRGVDTVANPRRYLLNTDADLALYALDVVSSRATLLDLESIIQGDRYLFIRDLYLQRRDFAVHDGKVESDPFLDDDDSGDESGDGGDAAPADGGEAPPTQDAPAAPEGDVPAPAPETAPDASGAATDPAPSGPTAPAGAETGQGGDMTIQSDAPAGMADTGS